MQTKKLKSQKCQIKTQRKKFLRKTYLRRNADIDAKKLLFQEEM